MENEKRVAFDNINLAPFRKKWAPFKHCPSEKLLKKQTSTWGASWISDGRVVEERLEL